MSQSLRPLALTMGEPAGIAPDITLDAWLALRHDPDIRFFYLGDPDLLERRARVLKRTVPIAAIAGPAAAAAAFPTALPVLPIELAAVGTPGALSSDDARAVERSLLRALDLVLAGEASAIVTNPVHKRSLYGAGFAHRGHTDFFGVESRRRGYDAEPVMMMLARDLRTVPLTVHVPIKDVPSLLSADLIVTQTRVVAQGLKAYFGLPRPRIAIAGLNPHAGEEGTMGGEEKTLIVPAIERLKRDGLDVSGPHSADALFHDDARHQFDAVMCMYHDQALIPVKTLAFHEGVNATLGLPFVRTSPDHGTALSLAGTGKANPSSLVHAVRLAWAMAAHAPAPRR
ncbi:MAG TPA: 4-hydroxythreonine-4-phosphate dehydrogenase PdxA [Aestuariivirgaceae bacterium]|nr:4-hydroxythreonine-4-phosphate dehydrogenase PdxA [Aestuariivirgaceae bacterium]